MAVFVVERFWFWVRCSPGLAGCLKRSTAVGAAGACAEVCTTCAAGGGPAAAMAHPRQLPDFISKPSDYNSPFLGLHSGFTAVLTSECADCCRRRRPRTELSWMLRAQRRWHHSRASRLGPAALAAAAAAATVAASHLTMAALGRAALQTACWQSEVVGLFLYVFLRCSAGPW